MIARAPDSRSVRRRALIAGSVVVLLALAAIVGPVLYDADPNVLDLARAAAPPGEGHPLGTDESGRDVLGRLLAGGRVSLAVGFAAVACSGLLGLSLGALAGLGGRRIDAFVMRLTDAMMSIPAMFLIITTLALFGTSVAGLVIAIGATSWMGLARLVRAELMAIREQAYVEAAKALGARPLRAPRPSRIAAPLAERAGEPDVWRRHGDPDGVGAFVHRARYPAAFGELGQHAHQRPELSVCVSLARGLSGPAHSHHRGGGECSR